MDIFSEGRVLLIDKPYDWTSFDVIRKMRSLIKIKKIGHAGTLDPLASGLLIVCTGKFTKKINEYMAQEKEYSGVITLGATTPTYDLESIPENFKDISHITDHDVAEAAKVFTGEIQQVPPIYSAVKKDGKRAYELARRGQDVELEPRTITVSQFHTVLKNNEVYFKIVCSTGTYIRSLANDLGKQLGCGGYLSALYHTRIGEFHLKDAMTLEKFEEWVKELKDQNG
ncbi:MAG: tRNA pseudouridine(55) synthase TruB [Chitinophagaceae bacterium]|nr:MAG: tRNA pseudouridine(55) synthase TruB [Chitinophagaceae bacterium]